LGIGVSLFAVVVLTGVDFSLEPKALAGDLLALHFATWVPSLRYTSVASATAIVATQPVWVALIARAQGHHIPGRAWLGIGVSLFAVVVLTGICGAVVVTPMMNAMGVRDYGARGFAVGLASHGIGTARAYSVNPVAGLFSGIAMGLNAIVTSIVVHIFL
jgi:drug/metabolite transporter (DMT)-like permease